MLFQKNLPINFTSFHMRMQNFPGYNFPSQNKQSFSDATMLFIYSLRGLSVLGELHTSYMLSMYFSRNMTQAHFNNIGDILWKEQIWPASENLDHYDPKHLQKVFPQTVVFEAEDLWRDMARHGKCLLWNGVLSLEYLKRLEKTKAFIERTNINFRNFVSFFR